MPKIDEQEARDYLVGKLSPQRDAELHALRETDADVNEELLALEEELYDQYLAGALPEPEKQYFETHFLSTASGKEKLRFAATFGQYREFQLAGKPSADRKSTRLNSSHSQISYAVFCLKKKKTNTHI